MRVPPKRRLYPAGMVVFLYLVDGILSLAFPGLYTLASLQSHVELKQSCLWQVGGRDWALR